MTLPKGFIGWGDVISPHSLTIRGGPDVSSLSQAYTVNTGGSSAGLRSVEAPGQQCYRKVVDDMSIST